MEEIVGGEGYGQYILGNSQKNKKIKTKILKKATTLF